jgi:DnaJ family protein A protein 1
MYKNPFEKGRLIIQFNITFPNKGDIDVRKLGDLEKVLPPRMAVEIPVNGEEHTLMDIDPSYRNSRGSRGQAYMDDMDDDMGHGGGARRVQCANQ